jgi:MFS family permease
VVDIEARCQEATGRPLPEPDQGMHPVVVAEKGAWKEIFTNPLYRRRTIIVLICWLLGYAGLIYGAGAFAAVYMVDHGGDAHFVFRTIAAAYAVVFVAFLINARISDSIERRNVLCSAGLLFAAAMLVMYLVPNLWIIAAAYIVGRVGTGIWLFNLYNYTAVAYPTRIRAVAFAWTDGLGHLGAWGGVTLLGPLYAFGPNHVGWFLWILIPGSIIPALLIRTAGIKQSGAVLEQVST